MIAILRETLRAVVSVGGQRKLKAADFGEAWQIFYAAKSQLKFNPFTRDDPPGLGDVVALRSGS
jgi:hypothetical protein